MYEVAGSRVVANRHFAKVRVASQIAKDGAANPQAGETMQNLGGRGKRFRSQAG
jgi:hypothetical protein